MKLLLLPFFFLAGFVLLSSAGLAQSTRKFSVGLKVGANFSQLNELSYQTPRLGVDGLPVVAGGQVVYDFFQQNESRMTGLVGGVFARYGNRVYVQPELLFSVKGGRYDIIRQRLEAESVNVKIGTVDLPLLLGVRFGMLRLSAGPMASLTVLNGDLKQAYSQYTAQPFSQTARQVQLGYQAGAGLTVAGLQIDLRREGGLKRGTSTQAAGTVPLRPTLWQLTVGFHF